MASRPIRRLSVLIVDDDRLVRTALARLLGDRHDVREVASGADAVVFVRSFFWVDVAVVDWRLPGKPSGAELVSELRAAGLGVVVMTGDVFARDEAEAAGAVFLEKPARAAEIESALAAAASSRHDYAG